MPDAVDFLNVSDYTASHPRGRSLDYRENVKLHKMEKTRNGFRLQSDDRGACGNFLVNSQGVGVGMGGKNCNTSR